MIGKPLLATLSFLFGLQAMAQMTLNNGLTAQQLGNNLAGTNVSVTNATISAANANQYGTFQYVGTDLGLNSVIILSSGNIFDAPDSYILKTEIDNIPVIKRLVVR